MLKRNINLTEKTETPNRHFASLVFADIGHQSIGAVCEDDRVMPYTPTADGKGVNIINWNGATFFIAREHTQAEYRWIEMFGHGRRMNMPWWGSFDPRAWDMASLMDFAVPVVACLLVWLVV